MDINIQGIVEKIEQEKVVNMINYLYDIAQEVAKEQKVKIKLSLNVENLALGWLEDRQRLNELSPTIIIGFRKDFKMLLEAEIDLLRKDATRQKKYWLIDALQIYTKEDAN